MTIDPHALVRVAISGAHSTGKTTLARDLTDALNAEGIATALAPEPIRMLSPGIGNGGVMARFTSLLKLHFARLSQEGYRCCIYDRSLLDFCVYLRAEQIDAEPVYALARELLPWYTPWFALHLYLPIEIDLTPDDRRPPSPAFRERVDRELRALARECDVTLTPVTGTPAERSMRALDLVREQLTERGAQIR